MATAFTGTVVHASQLDPAISAAGIANGYCPRYAEATAWDVEASGRLAVP